MTTPHMWLRNWRMAVAGTFLMRRSYTLPFLTHSVTRHSLEPTVTAPKKHATAWRGGFRGQLMSMRCGAVRRQNVLQLGWWPRACISAASLRNSLITSALCSGSESDMVEQGRNKLVGVRKNESEASKERSETEICVYRRWAGA